MCMGLGCACVGHGGQQVTCLGVLNLCVGKASSARLCGRPQQPGQCVTLRLLPVSPLSSATLCCGSALVPSNAWTLSLQP